MKPILFLSAFLATAYTDSQFCINSNTCSSSKICLNSSCRRCILDNDCRTAVPQKPYCNNTNPSLSSCQECLTNSHCPSASNSRCFGNVCSPCAQQSDCSHVSGKNQCFNGLCVGCFTNAQCPSGICDMTLNQCQASACPCSSTPTTPFCSGTICMECSASQNFCPSIGLFCSPDGSCQQCWQDSQCNSAVLSKCAGNSCTACSDDTQCVHITGKSRCLMSQGCVECLDSFDCAPGETCANNICVMSLSTPLTIKLFDTDLPDVYLIEFPPELVANALVDQGITIDLVGIDSKIYTYSLVKITETRYEVHFKVTETVPSTQLHVVYTYYSQIRYNINSQSQYEAQNPSKRIPYISDAEKQISQTIQNVGQKLVIGMAATGSSILLLGGNPIVLWALINLIQALYYLTFINVDYPANVQFFLRIFSLGKLDFIPNPFEWIDSNIEEESLPAPARFEEYNVNSFFLEEAGNMFFIAIVVFLTYLFSIMLKAAMNRMSRLITLFSTKISHWFVWSGAFKCLIASYPELTQAAFLQVRELNFETSTFTLSSVLGIVISACSILFPILSFMLIKKLLSSNGKIPRKYIGLVEDYTSKGKYSRYFTPIFLTKSLMIQIITVFIHDYPYIEIFLLILLSLTIILLLLKFKPFLNTTFNVINITSEILFEVAHFIIFVLILDDHIKNFSEQARLDIGWGLIAVCAVILLLNLLITVIESIKTMQEYRKAMQRLLRKEKIRMYERTPKIKGIVPQDKFEGTDILRPNRLDSQNTSTPTSFTSNLPILDISSLSKRRKVTRAGGCSVMLEHFQERSFGTQ